VAAVSSFVRAAITVRIGLAIDPTDLAKVAVASNFVLVATIGRIDPGKVEAESNFVQAETIARIVLATDLTIDPATDRGVIDGLSIILAG
jgi:hypothetical protein